MSEFASVKECYSQAWARRRLVIPTYLILRLATYAVIAPLLGFMVNLGVSLSNQSALTDQDIVMYLLTPTGFVVAIGLLSILLLSEVLSLGVLTGVIRAEESRVSRALRVGLVMVFQKYRALFIFATLLVLRILFITVPFVLACLLVVGIFMSEFDINYYLQERPAALFKAAALIVPLLLICAALLLSQLTAWALSLHFVLFDNTSPRGAFGKSARAMKGRRLRLVRDLLVWIGIRVALVVLVGFIMGGAIRLFPPQDGANLKIALVVSLSFVGIWLLGGLIVTALSMGALAKLLNAHFNQTGVKLAPLKPVQGGGVTLKRVLIGAFLVVGVGFASGAALLDRVKTEDKVQIIAHRGAAGIRPENTLASIQQALEDGADWVEIDVQETSMGDIVVVHDSDFMKLAGVNLKVWDSTLEELRDIDIGSWYDATYADQRTPLLREVLEMAKGRSKVLIELKYYGHDVALEERVARIVEEAGMEDQIAIMSLSYPAIQKMHQLRPSWRIGVLAASALGNAAKLDGDFIAISAGFASSNFVESTQAAGKDIYVWTVNDPLQMSKMISKGVDGLITDEPALVHKVLAFRAELNTAERLMLWISEAMGMEMSSKAYRDDQP